MRQVARQMPQVLHEMFTSSAVEARTNARRLGLRPEPGQTYQELGVVNVPEAAHIAVRILATKLTKAVYYQRTGSIFPVGGGIMFQWFTNAQKMEHGRIVLLEALSRIATMSEPLTRGGRDLKDQFDFLYSVEKEGALHMLQVTFGKVFGFVTIFSQTPGRLEAMEDQIKERTGSMDSPFEFLSTNRGMP